MPQQRDPIIYEVFEGLKAVPGNLLITPKDTQPTRQEGVLQPVVYIDTVSLMDETNAAVIVDVGFMVGSHIFWMYTDTLTTTGYWYFQHVHWTLTSDYQVVARVRIGEQNGGAREGDLVHMNVNGYYLEPYTSP